MFKLTLPNAIGKFNSYLRLLRVGEYNLNEMVNSKYYYPDVVCSSLKLIRERHFDDDIKVLLYCMMTDPKSYSKYGNYMNFYELCGDVKISKSLMYKPNTMGGNWIYKREVVDDHMKRRILSQKGFIEKMRNMDDEDILIKNEDVENYERFLTLIGKYKNHRFVPTLRIDMVWHGHMLDHIDYVKSTGNYFGKMLIHNDDVENEVNSKEKLENDFMKTGVLWKKEYGIDYVKKNQRNTSSSCGIDNPRNSNNNNSHNCSNCTSCSSCSSGCGD